MVSAQSAFFKMFQQARVWSQDAQGFQCQPIPLQSRPAEDGKWPAWRCQFQSDTKGKLKTWSVSIVEEEGVHEGVFAGPEESYNVHGQLSPWPIQAFKTDATKAIEIAKERKEAVAYMKKNPDIPITVLLSRTKRHPNLTWRVIWGTGVSDSNFSVMVDATTGEYLEILH